MQDAPHGFHHLLVVGDDGVVQRVRPLLPAMEYRIRWTRTMHDAVRLAAATPMQALVSGWKIEDGNALRLARLLDGDLPPLAVLAAEAVDDQVRRLAAAAGYHHVIAYRDLAKELLAVLREAPAAAVAPA